MEDIPDDAPTPKVNSVCTFTYKDSNLLHDLTMGRSASGILHIFTLLKPKSDQDRQTDSRTESKLGKRVDLYLPKPLALRKG